MQTAFISALSNAVYYKNCFCMDISPSGVQGVIYRNSEIFESKFEEIKENVRNSDYAGSDETKYSDSGTKWNCSAIPLILYITKNSL